MTLDSPFGHESPKSRHARDVTFHSSRLACTVLPTPSDRSVRPRHRSPLLIPSKARWVLAHAFIFEGVPRLLFGPKFALNWSLRANQGPLFVGRGRGAVYGMTLQGAVASVRETRSSTGVKKNSTDGTTRHPPSKPADNNTWQVPKVPALAHRYAQSLSPVRTCSW